MTLLELVVWLVIGFTGYQFWRIRAISEQTNTYLKQYCDKHNLQLLSVARAKTRFSFKYGKPDWHSLFNFEFSSNGEDRYTGEVELIGVRVMRTEVPPHRVWASISEGQKAFRPPIKCKKKGNLTAPLFPGILSILLRDPLRLKSSRLKSVYAPFHLLSRLPVRATLPCVGPFPFFLNYCTSYMQCSSSWGCPCQAPLTIPSFVPFFAAHPATALLIL